MKKIFLTTAILSLLTSADDIYNGIISTYQTLLNECQLLKCTADDIRKYQDAIADAKMHLAPPAAGTSAKAPLWDATPEGSFPSISRDQTWGSIYQQNQQNK